MLDNQVGLGRAQFIEAIVTRKDSAGADVAVVGGFDVVLHVAKEHGLSWVQFVIPKDLSDEVFFVVGTEVGLVEERTKS